MNESKRKKLLTFLTIFLTACTSTNGSIQTGTPVPTASSRPVSTVSLTPMTTLTPTSTFVWPTGTPIPVTVVPTLDAVQAQQLEEIKEVIQAYFELRYQARSLPQPESFQLEEIGNLVSNEPDAKAFLDAELGKLTLGLKYAELNHSRYVTYKFFLTFNNFNVDSSTNIATVLIVEDNEIVSELSTENNPENPHVARMFGLKHEFILRQEQGQWKIVSDIYNDFLWRGMRNSEITIEERIKEIDALLMQTKAASTTMP